MFDLFTIFTKGGIVLWFFQDSTLTLRNAVNSLIREVIILERNGLDIFFHKRMNIQFKLDNEFELLFIVAYQEVVKLASIDKFLDQVMLAFRFQFYEKLKAHNYFKTEDFNRTFQKIKENYESKNYLAISIPKKMKKFEMSEKFTKTLEHKHQYNITSKTTNSNTLSSFSSLSVTNCSFNIPENEHLLSNSMVTATNNDRDLPNKYLPSKLISASKSAGRRSVHNKNKFISINSNINNNNNNNNNNDNNNDNKHNDNACSNSINSNNLLNMSSTSHGSNKIRVKSARTWEGQVSKADYKYLNYSDEPVARKETYIGKSKYSIEKAIKGSMKGELPGIDTCENFQDTIIHVSSSTKDSSSKVLNFFRGIASSKPVKRDKLIPILEKMEEILITKNVASHIAAKLCESVMIKLEGRILATFSTIKSEVYKGLEEALYQILSPKKHINILRDIEKKKCNSPYIITFCGVNGVGKSTNLAKIGFWLLENNFRVLIAACDTFRSGAVEQLRTHTKCLQNIFPSDEMFPNVSLFSHEYGLDPSGVAQESILYGRSNNYDVILIDTAGRMQDNKPLMIALAKLIYINCPDLVLFVGEALVGNEAVDQLTKFNQALIDFSNPISSYQEPIIDGILLTKFDTIDDKVGAAISMAYVTGQPIYFVGTGQQYTDIKGFSPDAVVKTLLK